MAVASAASTTDPLALVTGAFAPVTSLILAPVPCITTVPEPAGNAPDAIGTVLATTAPPDSPCSPLTSGPVAYTVAVAASALIETTGRVTLVLPTQAVRVLQTPATLRWTRTIRGFEPLSLWVFTAART